MIISFSVSNFRSFASEETFSLVATKDAASHPNHLVDIPNSKERALRTGVIYGANGAGKSNLFKALTYMKDLVIRPRPKNVGTDRDPFLLTTEPPAPTSLELQFIAGDTHYRLGLKVDDQSILEEWLVRVKGGREAVVYERTTSANGVVTVELPKGSKPGQKLSALATVGGPANQTFLATVLANLDQPEWTIDFAATLHWFQTSLRLVAPDESIVPVGHFMAKHPEFLAFAGEFLRACATGVDELEAVQEEVSEEEIRKLIPNRLFLEMLDREGVDSVLMLPDGREIVTENDGKTKYFSISVSAKHQISSKFSIPFSLAQESDGTRRLLNLIPAIAHLQQADGVYFIDEIDRSLHPMLVSKFLEFFLNSCAGGNNQIIITTHESNLLNLDLLRRDEIWFAKKGPNRATQLSSLADFQVRKDHEIRKHYLQGRFGAVPFLGNLDRLQPNNPSLGPEKVPAS